MNILDTETVKAVHHNNPSRTISVTLPKTAIYFLWAVIFVVLVAIFYASSGAQYDWRAVYAAAHDIHHYEEHKFYGLPQSLLLVPHAYVFSLEFSDAINLAIIAMLPYFVVRKLEMGWKPLFLIYTFPLYWHLLSVGNIDWIPLLAWLSPPGLAVMFALAKPQVFGAMSLILLKKHGWQVLIPFVILNIITLIIWDTKPIEVLLDFNQRDPQWNIASVLFPFLVPVGLYLLYKAYHSENVPLAAVSSVFLVPYIAAYSFGAWYVILACYYRAWAIGLYIVVWTLFAGFFLLALLS